MFMFILKNGYNGHLTGKIIDAGSLDEAVRAFILSDVDDPRCFVSKVITDAEFNMNGRTRADVEGFWDSYDAVDGSEESYRRFIVDNLEKLIEFIKAHQGSNPDATFAIVEADPVSGSHDIKSASKL